jgi:predicted ATPase/DNA-binding CsgD family transcriptional regulator
LLTLTGPGGSGKTRLALAAAAQVQNQFAAGLIWIALAPVEQPELVVGAIAQACGVKEVTSPQVLEPLTHYLRDHQMLLVLDNFEHVAAAAPVLTSLLSSAAGLKLLVTSRTVLHLNGEYELPVPPLMLPDPNVLPSMEKLAQYPAIRLFVERAQAVRSSFQLTPATAAAVAKICWRLDGLPLAIELAAVRCKILSPQALLARLTSPLDALTGGGSDRPARQQTLRATLDWSYQLLEADQQLLLRRLAVFVGGWTVEAATTICALDPEPTPLAMLDKLTALVDHSLLRQEETSDGEPRFNMLETIHEYAAEHLATSGESTLLRERHLRYYLALAEEAEPKLSGAEQAVWLERLGREQGNLRAALAASKELPGGATLGLRLAAALWWFWWVYGHVSEGRAWLENLLALTDPSSDTHAHWHARATAHYRASFLASAQMELTAVQTPKAKGLTLFRDLDDPRGLAWARYSRGIVALVEGNFAEAITDYQESLNSFRRLGDARGAAWTLNDLSVLALVQGEYEQATSYSQECLALSRQVGSRRDIAACLANLATIAQARGEYALAAAYDEECLTVAKEIGDAPTVATSLHSLAYLRFLQHDYAQASDLFEEALAIYQLTASKVGMARCLVGLAATAWACGEATRAAHLWGAAIAQHAHVRARMDPNERVTFEQAQVAVRAHLGETAFRQAWDAGQHMRPDQAIAIAEPAPLAPSSPPTSPTSSIIQPSGLAKRFGLTERELEILRLLAAGLSYAAIAQQLVISPHTVNRHLSTIYTKLNVNSRHAATRLAINHHLV